MDRLADRLQARPRRHAGPDCQVRKALTGLNEQDRQDLLAVLYDLVGWPVAADLEESLRREGIEVSAWVITRHRRGDCRTCRASGLLPDSLG